MCGIAGIISKDTSLVNRHLVKKMTDIINHRGPDGEAQWISENGMVGFGHRRLSIIDLSHDADQPMHYMERYSLVFNGEIYNYIELREILLKQGYRFKTQSDTEVLLALYDRDGENCLLLLDGMFAFALFDAKENTVFCARDRFGEKPFFYSYEKGKSFYFGSEMKCLWEGGIPKEVNNRMLFNYLAYGLVDNPADLSETFYTNCTKLPHAHSLSLNLNSLEFSIKKYFDIDWKNVNHSISLEQAKIQFKELFYTSVRRRLRSDVPIGSSLSGGLDSSLVVSVIDELKRGTAQTQTTFSAVFPGFKKDERTYMDLVINKCQVNPYFVTPNEQGLIDDFEKLCWHQEEPFGSASIYAQYCVMKLAKENNVTVLLDGQGADEVLAGYHPYFIQYFKDLQKTNPTLYKEQFAKYKQLHQENKINVAVNTGIKNLAKRHLSKNAHIINKYHQYYKQFRNDFFSKDFFATYFKESFKVNYHYESLNHMLYANTMEKGLQELLRYADRNSMAHSREVRLPFLSHELVSFIFSLPASFKIKDGWTKWIMRESFDQIMPHDIAWRKDKIGYEPPQKNWMEGAFMQEKIKAKRTCLVDHGILSKSFLDKEIVGEDASINIGNSWRILTSNV